MAYSVDQLCAHVSNVTGLSDAQGTDDRSILDVLANDAIQQVMLDTACYVIRMNVTLVANVDEYQLDRGILRILNIVQPGASPNSIIQITSLQQIAEFRLGQASGAVRLIALAGSNLLLMAPTPTTADTMLFYAVPVPTLIYTTSDIFGQGLPVFAKRAVQAYMCARAMEHNHDYSAARLRGGQIITGAAAYWQGVYDEEVKMINKNDRQLAGRRLATARIGYPGNWQRSNRNDVYPSGSYN